MKYTSQLCCDETMDGKMALYREKVAFVDFRGRSSQWPHRIHPWQTENTMFQFVHLSEGKRKHYTLLEKI